MKLLIILICLGVQRFLNIRFSLSEFDWFKPYRALVQKTLSQSGLMKDYIGLAIIVLPVAVLVWLVNAIFGGSLAGAFIIGAIVLFYCTDARDMAQQLSTYLGGEKSEKGKSAEEELKAFLKEELPVAPNEQARAVSSKVLLWTQHHVFSVIFWYMLLGVFGAITYFLVHRLSHEAGRQDSDAAAYANASQVVQGVMAWIPVRLAGLSYGVVGSFGNLFNHWMKHIAGGLDLEQKLPVLFGLTAINADPENSAQANVEENKGILDSVFKAEIVWVAVIALLFLISLI